MSHNVCRRTGYTISSPDIFISFQPGSIVLDDLFRECLCRMRWIERGEDCRRIWIVELGGKDISHLATCSMVISR